MHGNRAVGHWILLKKIVSLLLLNNLLLMNQTDSERNNTSLPETYLDLILKVGGKGKYQYIFAFVYAFSYYVTGIVLMSTSFIFNNPEFDCEAFGLLTDDCYTYVCSLPSDRWASFVTADANNFRSLANQFGHYYCDDEVYLNLYSSAPYLGTMIGCFFMAIVADNFGRRITFLISSSTTFLGCILLIFSQNLWMASIALILCGMGSDSNLGTLGSSAAECLDDNFRQKVMSIVQGTFTLGALLVTLFYYLFEDWKITSIYCLTIPAFINAVVIYLYLKESPMYLIVESPEKALKEINEIGWMNKKERDLVKMEDIQNVMKCQQTIKYNKASTPLDVFRYSSLRTITIAQGLISMATFLMYYGPTLIVSQFGFDMYTSETVLNVSDLLTYYPLMLIIDKVRRRTCATVLFGTATVISFALTFISKPTGCDLCATIFIQLALVFIFRFAISMQFALMAIYQTELYPTRVRNISGGVLAVFGTTSSTLSPIIMGAFTRAEISHFILFTVLGLVATGSYMFCPETFGKLCPEEIEQIEYEKYQHSVGKSGVEGEKLHHY